MNAAKQINSIRSCGTCDCGGAGEKVLERPILCCGSMVRAILEGRKTHTRRVIKPQPDTRNGIVYGMECAGSEYFLRREPWHFAAPHYKPGTRLWAKETFCWHLCAGNDDHGEAHYRADSECCPRDGERIAKWRPSIFMPRHASRITLEIESIRVERVQEITEEDAEKEGVERLPSENVQPWRDYLTGGATTGPRWSFATLWDSINAKRGFGWAVNPWVWVIQFRRIKP